MSIDVQSFVQFGRRWACSLRFMRTVCSTGRAVIRSVLILSKPSSCQGIVHKTISVQVLGYIESIVHWTYLTEAQFSSSSSIFSSSSRRYKRLQVVSKDQRWPRQFSMSPAKQLALRQSAGTPSSPSLVLCLLLWLPFSWATVWNKLFLT